MGTSGFNSGSAAELQGAARVRHRQPQHVLPQARWLRYDQFQQGRRRPPHVAQRHAHLPGHLPRRLPQHHHRDAAAKMRNGAQQLFSSMLGSLSIGRRLLDRRGRHADVDRRGIRAERDGGAAPGPGEVHGQGRGRDGAAQPHCGAAPGSGEGESDVHGAAVEGVLNDHLCAE
uniref:Uncharacterized protein n=1 Tax=Oryza rufipogon TaxID=4529 RepID=A0A0E0PIT0_ORYRU